MSVWAGDKSRQQQLIPTILKTDHHISQRQLGFIPTQDVLKHISRSQNKSLKIDIGRVKQSASCPAVCGLKVIVEYLVSFRQVSPEISPDQWETLEILSVIWDNISPHYIIETKISTTKLDTRDTYRKHSEESS